MKKLVLGIDGGGTTTNLALADLDGKIVKRAKVGPSSLRNESSERAIANVLEGVTKIIPRGREPVSTFIGFPALQEEYFSQKEEIEALLNEKVKGCLSIGSDQLVAFRSGTDSNTGVVIIAGTGGVVRAFKEGKSAKASGWGYFADEGSGFWAGLRAYRKITKELDGRGRKTMITEMVFDRWNLESGNDLNRKIYEDPIKWIPKLSIMVDLAQREGDSVATEILRGAAEEIFNGVRVVSEKMNLEDFPLILVGGMFKSGFLEKEIAQKAKKEDRKINIIKPEREPVFGAVKLAISNYEER